MAANPSSRWYWNDWENDLGLQLCSLAAQGLWMRMLSLAARSEPVGYISANGRALTVDELASLVGHGVDEVLPLLEELDANHVFSRDRKGRIYNRRMVRDAKNRVLSVKSGKKGGNPRLLQPPDNDDGIPDPLTPTDNGEGSAPRARPLPLPLPKKESKEDSEADASAGTSPAADPVKAMWDRGLQVLIEGGCAEKKARPLIGKWRREFGDAALMAAIASAEDDRATEPIAFISGCLAHSRNGSNGNGRITAATERFNRGRQATLDAVLERERARDAGEPAADCG